MNYDNLDKLIAEAQEGDSQAFSALFERYWSLAYYSCYKYLGNEKDAEDATQEVFITLHRRLPNLKHPRLFAKMVKWLAAEVSRDFGDRKKRRPDRGSPVNIEDVAGNLHEEKEEFLPGELLEQDELKQELLRLIDHLPKKQREVIMLHYFNELSPQEIAVLTGSPGSTVRNRLFHARQALKEQASQLLEGREVKTLAAMPVLTQLFNEEMAVVATSQVKEAIWQSLRLQLPLMVESGAQGTRGMDMEDNSAATTKTGLGQGSTSHTPAAWLKAVAGGAAATTVACTAVLGVNLYQDLALAPGALLEQQMAAVSDSTELVAQDGILADLEKIDGPESFQAFIEHYAVVDQVGTISGGGLAYNVYRKEWDELVILVGYAQQGAYFQLAYLVADRTKENQAGLTLPLDPQGWIMENSKW